MTHMLIPITEALKEAIRIGDTSFLADAMFSGKQISLDEEIKDSTIDKHISKVFSDWTPYYREPFKAGYKQALKDLL